MQVLAMGNAKLTSAFFPKGMVIRTLGEKLDVVFGHQRIRPGCRMERRREEMNPAASSALK